MRANVSKQNRALLFPARIFGRHYGNDRCDKNRISKLKADCAVVAYGIAGRIIPGVRRRWSILSATLSLAAWDVATASAGRAALPLAHSDGVGALPLGMERRPSQDRNERERTDW